MNEQIGNALTFVAFYTEDGVGKTGLTVTVDVYGPAYTKIVTDGVVTAIGGGLYRYTLASVSVTAEGAYSAVFKTADVTVDQKHVPALWTVGKAGVEHLDADLTDIKAKTDTIGALSVTVRSPVSMSGTITIYRGYDYKLADGRDLSFVSDDWGVDIEAVGAALTFVVDEYLFIAATAIDATTISVDLTAADTELVLRNAAEYSLFYEIGTDRILLKRGLLAVVDDTVEPAPALTP